MGKSEKRKKTKDDKAEKFFKKLKKLVRAMPDTSSGSKSEDTRLAISRSAVDHADAKIAQSLDQNESTTIEGSSTEISESPEITEKQVTIAASNQLSEDSTQTFDEETLRILGIDIKADAPDLQLHPSLAINWEKWISGGLKKEEQTEVLAKYARTGNCRLEAPNLNAEVASSLFDSAIKRDKYLMNAQNIRGTAMAALGTAITLLLSHKDEGIDEYQLLECLADAGRLLAYGHRLDTITRKSFITPTLDKKVKVVLDETKPDAFLFGENLTEKIRTAKSIEKVGIELKSQVSIAKTPNRNSNSRNWRGPSSSSNRGGYQAGNNQRGTNKFVKFQQKQTHSYQQRDRRAQNQSRGPNSQNKGYQKKA